MRIVKYDFQPHGDERGHLAVVEEFRDVPFRMRRIYYMYGTAEGITRGRHAHKSLEQVLVCVHGNCSILLDDGKERRVVSLNSPSEGLYLARDVWHEMFDFSPGAVLLVLASDLYDEADYIRDYDEFIRYVEAKR